MVAQQPPTYYKLQSTTMKTHEEVAKEGTCQKRLTITEIYDENDVLLARESNRCNPDGGICHRMNITQSKAEYSVDSSCNWIHSEINAINALPKNCRPHKAICYGHTFFCDSCESALKRVGVTVFQIKEHF